jgi:hypothetical protein
METSPEERVETEGICSNCDEKKGKKPKKDDKIDDADIKKLSLCIHCKKQLCLECRTDHYDDQRIAVIKYYKKRKRKKNSF